MSGYSAATAALVVMALATASCAVLFGLDGYSGGNARSSLDEAGAAEPPSDATAPLPACIDRAAVAPPDGWEAVVVGNGGSCPGAKLTLVENPRGGGSCTCACGATMGNPCQTGQGAVHIGFTDPTTCSFAMTIETDGNCHPNPLGSSTNSTSIAIDSKAPSKVPCVAAAWLPEIDGDARLDACLLPPSAPSQDAGACEPGGMACLIRRGEVECPTGFGARRLVVSGDDVVDGRTCGPCTCSSNATSCVNQNVSSFTDGNCLAQSASVPAGNACAPIVAGQLGESYRFTAQPNVTTCSPAAPTSKASGSVTPKSQTTLCCKPS